MSNRDYNRRVFDNNTEYYEFLRKERGDVKNLQHYGTPNLYMPTLQERMTLTTDKHVWRYGDRFYKLAHQYYGSTQYWWVIAWYNGYMTEADIFMGDPLYIPINLEAALELLRVY